MTPEDELQEIFAEHDRLIHRRENKAYLLVGVLMFFAGMILQLALDHC